MTVFSVLRCLRPRLGRPSRAAALCLAALLQVAGAAPAPVASIGALAGRWDADVSQLPIPAAARPQRVTIRFTPAADGRLATRVEVVDPTGQLLTADSLAPLDGTPVPVQGPLEADTTAVSMPVPGVLVMQLTRAGVPGSTRIYTLTADGQTLIETAANVGDDGRPYVRTHRFSRVP